jgi:hypothetical protein
MFVNNKLFLALACITLHFETHSMFRKNIIAFIYFKAGSQKVSDAVAILKELGFNINSHTPGMAYAPERVSASKEIESETKNSRFKEKSNLKKEIEIDIEYHDFEDIFTISQQTKIHTTDTLRDISAHQLLSVLENLTKNK